MRCGLGRERATAVADRECRLREMRLPRLRVGPRRASSDATSAQPHSRISDTRTMGEHDVTRLFWRLDIFAGGQDTIVAAGSSRLPAGPEKFAAGNPKCPSAPAPLFRWISIRCRKIKIPEDPCHESSAGRIFRHLWVSPQWMPAETPEYGSERVLRLRFVDQSGFTGAVSPDHASSASRRRHPRPAVLPSSLQRERQPHQERFALFDEFLANLDVLIRESSR